MNILNLLIVVALLAVVFALFAWVRSANQNAIVTRPKIGNANRKFSRRHLRKLYLAPLLFQRLLSFLPGQPVARGGIQFANIGEGTFDSGVRSYTPDAATTSRYLIYKVGTDGDHSALCGAGEIPIGQSDDSADAGVPIAINLFGAKPGMLRVITDGTIANGDYVKTAANGKATKATTADAGQFGRALFGTDTSSADGDVITVVHTLPDKLAF